MTRFLGCALHSKVIRLVKVRSSKEILDGMCAMLDRDSRFVLEDLVVPAWVEDSSFIMDEREARIRKPEY